jgi:hypothetical protein
MYRHACGLAPSLFICDKKLLKIQGEIGILCYSMQQSPDENHTSTQNIFEKRGGKWYFVQRPPAFCISNAISRDNSVGTDRCFNIFSNQVIALRFRPSCA